MSSVKPFTRVEGVAAPLFLADINTDILMPSNWNIAHPDRLGDGLMRLWRFDAEGREIAGFVLNEPRYQAPRFLIAGPNFGTGSSRETAVWALLQFGIRAVIAPNFGEIFEENAFQNGLLPIRLPLDVARQLAEQMETAARPELCIDLEKGRIETAEGHHISFDIAPDRRHALLQGLDATLVIRSFAADIAAFQEADRRLRPWIYAR